MEGEEEVKTSRQIFALTDHHQERILTTTEFNLNGFVVV